MRINIFFLYYLQWTPVYLRFSIRGFAYFSVEQNFRLLRENLLIGGIIL